MLLRKESLRFLKIIFISRTANNDSNKVAVKNQYGLNPVACKEGGTAKFNCLLETASRLDSSKSLKIVFLICTNETC